MNDENVILSEAGAASVVEESFGGGARDERPFDFAQGDSLFSEQITMAKFQMKKPTEPVLPFDHWDFDIVWNLEFRSCWRVRTAAQLPQHPAVLNPPYVASSILTMKGRK
ncbi:MAG: hypothetical protein HY673_23495 [Chloroflexi bacterium]|nr:hypothetical protein [Chloroflexota bacterium]